jgi:heterodisulfide reductase subunit C/nitrate reductase gamma subunit
MAQMTTFFNIGLYLSLGICGLGIVYRLHSWLSRSLEKTPPTTATRLAAIGRKCLTTVFSKRMIPALQALVMDILFQRTIFKSSPWQWMAHMAVLYGFVLLVLMHALDDLITTAIFPEYASTLNPFFFLRNLFGVMVVAGVTIFIVRRLFQDRSLGLTAGSDRIAIFLLSAILLSGFFLESVQIVSEPIFHQMVDDYLGSDDPEEIEPLKLYWSREYGVVFSEPPAAATSEAFDTGQELHEESCAACHSRPTAAFVSYVLAKSYGQSATAANNGRVDIWFWYIHVAFCFIGLAYLPFSKFFHLVSVPVNLIVQAASDDQTLPKPVSAERQMIGLDACTHCGACSRSCSVAPVYRMMGNSAILPSEKLTAVKLLASRRRQKPEAMQRLSHGSFICTDCYRCTTVCPSKIPLHDLWQESKKRLLREGFPPPHGWAALKGAAEWADEIKRGDAPSATVPDELDHDFLMDKFESFSACAQCSVCSGVCPVVEAGDTITPKDMTPQQVMNLLRLGLKDLAMGSRMVWDCVTCYQCQEHCPQGIRIADIFYELRNRACRSLPAVQGGKKE